MKIKMLKTEQGSPDGKTIETYLVNQEYDVPESLYRAFVSGLKVAVPVNLVIEDIKEVEEQIKEKKMEVAPKNKAMEVPVNKNVEVKKETKPVYTGKPVAKKTTVKKTTKKGK
jgi:hypothetical protein